MILDDVKSVSSFTWNMFLQSVTDSDIIIWWNLRKDLSLKERNLKVRNITWVFQPVSWLCFYNPCSWSCGLSCFLCDKLCFLHIVLALFQSWGQYLWQERWCNHRGCSGVQGEEQHFLGNKGIQSWCGTWCDHVPSECYVQTHRSSVVSKGFSEFVCMCFLSLFNIRLIIHLFKVTVITTLDYLFALRLRRPKLRYHTWAEPWQMFKNWSRLRG